MMLMLSTKSKSRSKNSKNMEENMNVRIANRELEKTRNINVVKNGESVKNKKVEAIVNKLILEIITYSND